MPELAGMSTKNDIRFSNVGFANVWISLRPCEIFHKLHSVAEIIDPLEFYRSVGARIRQLRGSRLTQEELAKRAGLSRASVVNLEAGRQKLLLHHAFSIARTLGVSPSEFIAPLEPKRHHDVDLSSAGNAAEFVKQALNHLAQQNPMK